MEKVHRERLDATLRALERSREKPLTAAELAEFCGLQKGHESNRRRIRELVAELREQGRRICAGFKAGEKGEEGALGYWLARDDGEWHAYLESRRLSARFEFVAVRTMARAASEQRSGQGKLFEEGTKQARMEWARF